jgi:hypothetical protein
MDPDSTQLWNRLRRNLEASRQRGNDRHAQIDVDLQRLDQGLQDLVTRVAILEQEIVELEVTIDAHTKQAQKTAHKGN